LSRLIYIFIAALLYLLGLGIAHYLSGVVTWNSFFLGLIWLVLMLLGFQYLNEYFDQGIVPENPAWWRTPFSGGSGALGPGKLSRPVALWAGLTCLTITASITVLLYQFEKPGTMATIMLGLILLGELILVIPPIRLVSSGYGELSMTLFRVE
jgi:1,4-dihydroxy-2-naphthoate octaprenyltransferase